MELGKQIRASLMAIIHQEYKERYPERSTSMVPHDCMGEWCPCQLLLPDCYRICEFHGHYAPMKSIGGDWFFFSAAGSAFAVKWNEAKWYRSREDALNFIVQRPAHEEELTAERSHSYSF